MERFLFTCDFKTLKFHILTCIQHTTCCHQSLEIHQLSQCAFQVASSIHCTVQGQHEFRRWIPPYFHLQISWICSNVNLSIHQTRDKSWSSLSIPILRSRAQSIAASRDYIDLPIDHVSKIGRWCGIYKLQTSRVRRTFCGFKIRLEQEPQEPQHTFLKSPPFRPWKSIFATRAFPTSVNKFTSGVFDKVPALEYTRILQVPGMGSDGSIVTGPGGPCRPATPCAPLLPGGPCNPWAPDIPVCMSMPEIKNIEYLKIISKIARPGGPGGPALPWFPGGPLAPVIP